MASIKSDKFWTRVSCNTNRGADGDGLRWSKQYGNLPANRTGGSKLLAICDVDPNYHKRITNWEREPMSKLCGGNSTSRRRAESKLASLTKDAAKPATGLGS